MRMLFSRFEKELDAQCELGIGNERSLHRWLKSALPIAANTIKDNVIREGAKGFRNKMNYSPKGIQE